MKRFLFALLLVLCPVGHCLADLAFVGFSADNSDDFAVVALQDYSASTQFRFSDNEWNGSSFNSGEGFFSWTSSSAISAGTILRFNNTSLASRTVTDGFGSSVSGTFAGGTMALGNSDEGIYAYFGSSDTSVTTELASIRIDNNVAAGSAFSSGVNVLLNIPPDGDIWVYTGPQTVTGTFADFIPLLTNASNWTLQGDGAGNQTYTPPSGTFSAVPEPGSMLMLAIVACTGGAFRLRKFRKKC